MGPGTQTHHPDLLVGHRPGDAATVFRLRADLALIQSVDLFPPIVADRHTSGGIAAAHAMSAIYALGGEVTLGLHIATWPTGTALDELHQFQDGGAAKMAEVGAVVADGHTVAADQPKYGLCVTGTVHPDRVLSTTGAQVGDRIYLTKPLGTGILLAASQREAVAAEHVAESIAAMLKLNRQAAQLIQEIGVHACVGVNGHSLLGHAAELAERSGVRLNLAIEALPFLSGAMEYAELGFVPEATARNRVQCAARGVRLPAALRRSLNDLLHDPQTSGGLLLSIAADRAAVLEAAFAREKAPLWPIGEVAAGSGVEVAE